jgi:hypothetical protein
MIRALWCWLFGIGCGWVTQEAVTSKRNGVWVGEEVYERCVKCGKTRVVRLGDPFP